MTTTCETCGAWTPGTRLCVLHDPGSFPEPARDKAGNDSRWGTAREIAFVRGLHAKDREKFRKYVVTAELRHNWEGIDAAAVKAECRRLLNG
jgi:hypothetical protein